MTDATHCRGYKLSVLCTGSNARTEFIAIPGDETLAVPRTKSPPQKPRQLAESRSASLRPQEESSWQRRGRQQSATQYYNNLERKMRHGGRHCRSCVCFNQSRVAIDGRNHLKSRQTHMIPMRWRNQSHNALSGAGNNGLGFFHLQSIFAWARRDLDHGLAKNQ